MCLIPVDGNMVLNEAPLAGPTANVIVSDDTNCSVLVRGQSQPVFANGTYKEILPCDGGRLGLRLVCFADSEAIQQL